MVKKIFNKLTKVGKWMDKGVIHRTIENINGDPECSWVFLTTVLLLGCFGIGLCLVWFYHMIKEGMPTWAIIFDSAIILFCAWAIVRCIIPMSKQAYRDIDEKRNKQEK